ncbi:hypothetical protein ACS127_10385 [Amphibacillus sp. Q70]|uniref:hypothetical protein n=1 Tax=Amphibacillus sp. Q70 TaxID=3453416 RepID=UPI003F85E1CC
MSVNKKIFDALAPLKVDVEWQDYSGSDDTYIRFFFLPQVPFSLDDEGGYVTHYVQIDIFSKWDYTELVKNTKKLLKQAGLRKNFEDENYEKDTGFYHKILRYYFITEEE